MLAKVLVITFIGILFGVSVNSVDVKTSSGVVRGKSLQVFNKTINQFWNVPYAVPPVGKLRYSKPVPIKEPKTGIIDATKAGKACLQYAKTNQENYSEDCLVLNIFTSNSSQSKPVMFWIHGGGFWNGDSFGYDGSVLATYDVVIVTVEYRLGPFGFFYSGDESAPGNMGLYDQQLAIKWVKQNIHSFGGDPNEITIFGESAGSWSVSTQILSPLSKGLFKRAILESGAVYHNKDIPNLTKESALNTAKSYAQHFNCTGDKWIDCLRGIDSKTLETYAGYNPYPIFETEFLPLLPQKAFKSHNYITEIDIMGGVMQNEGPSLVPYVYPEAEHLKNEQEFKDLLKKVPYPNLNVEKISDFYLKGIDTNSTVALKKAFWNFFGDIFITCPAYHFAKAFSVNTPKRNVFFYEWTYLSDAMRGGCTKEMGICHGQDVGYVYGGPLWRNDPVDKKFAEDVIKMWTNFAKNGNPLDGFPADYHWPRMTQVGVANGVIKAKEMSALQPNHIFDNYFEKSCDGFWKSYYE